MTEAASPWTRTDAYRPDIDGLRAVAVLAVLIHHMNPALLPGGFIGVDIFFVISGYLITRLVYKELREGRFSFGNFYKRRINRLLPALTTVIAVTVAISAFVLSPADLIKAAKSGFLALVGLSNIYFWREYGNYFAGPTSEAPLLHTWSLGVEEQFYLIWPLSMLVLVRICGRFLLGVLAVLTVMAISLSEIAVGLVASASYFMLPARFFELMIGGVLAIAVAHGWRPSRASTASLCLATGIVLIVLSLVYIDKGTAFPGLSALYPSLGVALVIWAGSGARTLRSPLTSRLLVGIGLISYSLYLWHWPFLAFLSYGGIRIDVYIGILVTGLSFICAWLSWRFIEIPMRQSGGRMSGKRVAVQRFLMPVTAAFALAAVAMQTGGLPGRFDPSVARLERTLTAKPEELRPGCHVPSVLYARSPNPDDCRLGAEKATIDAVLLGDSFANHFTGMIDVMGRASGLTIMDYTMNGCPPLLAFNIEGSPTYAWRCKERNRVAYETISTLSLRKVILAASWPDSTAVAESLSESIEAIRSAGAEVTIVLSNAKIEQGPNCPIRSIMYGSTPNCADPRPQRPRYFKEIQSRYPAVQFIDPNEVICDDERCYPVLAGTLLYRDKVHLNDIGSRLIGQRLLDRGVRLQ